MTSMTSTMVQIATMAAMTNDLDAVLRHVDSIQMALEMAGQTRTADAFVSLAEMIHDGCDPFAEIPKIAAMGLRAAEVEPDSMLRLVAKAKAACKNIRAGDAKVLFEISAMASALASWIVIANAPNARTTIRVEDALLEIGRSMAGIAITQLTGKVVPAGF
jgi:hypothetical protein